MERINMMMAQKQQIIEIITSNLKNNDKWINAPQKASKQ